MSEDPAGKGATSHEQLYAMSRDEFREWTKTEEYEQLAATFRQRLAATPGAAVGLASAFYKCASTEVRTGAEAVNAVIFGIGELVNTPEIQASAEIARVLTEVQAALSGLTIFDATANDVAAAFAMPARRMTNRLNAKQPRLDGVLKAEAYFKKWEQNPDLYPNMAAYKKDLLSKELCLDIGTAGRWLKGFVATLPSDSPLRQKLGKR